MLERLSKIKELEQSVAETNDSIRRERATLDQDQHLLADLQRRLRESRQPEPLASYFHDLCQLQSHEAARPKEVLCPSCLCFHKRRTFADKLRLLGRSTVKYPKGHDRRAIFEMAVRRVQQT